MHCEFCNASDHTVHACDMLAAYGGAVVEAGDDVIEIDAATVADVMDAATACGVAIDERAPRRMTARERDEYRTFMSEVAT